MKKVILTAEFAHCSMDWHFSPGIDTGEFVFFSGITGTRADEKIASDAECSFERRFEFCARISSRRHLKAFIKVKDEFVSEPYPAWTAIGFAELISQGALVEIRAIAKRS